MDDRPDRRPVVGTEFCVGVLLGILVVVPIWMTVVSVTALLARLLMP